MAARRVTVVVSLPAAFLVACGTSVYDGPLELRLRNAGVHDFLDVTFESGAPPLHFEEIPAGAATPFQEVARSYRYGFLELTVQGKQVRLVPIDYVGESPLDPGRYTFEIEADSASGITRLEPRRER